MAVPWLRLLDLVLGVTDLARGARPRTSLAAPDAEPLASSSRALGHLETRLAGVVVAALKEAFDRDSRRLELERDQLEAERERAERALRLELARQAGEREIGRLRLVAGVAVAGWLGTLVFAARLAGGPVGARVGFGIGWLLLLGALGSAFAALSAVASDLDRMDEDRPRREFDGGVAGTVAPWLIVAGLAVIGLAILLV
jgi:hypothetical protein